MKKLLILAFILLVLPACQNQHFGKQPIRTDLQLKADESDILYFKEIDFVKETAPGNFVKEDKIILYQYVTDEEVGRQYMGKNAEDLSRRTENSLHFKTDKKKNGQDVYIMKAWGGKQFIERGNSWYKVDIATTTTEAWEEQTTASLVSRIFGKTASADTTTAQGEAGDGRVTGDNASWNNCRAAATGEALNDATDVVALTTKGDNYNIARVELPIDTADLPDAADVSSGTLHFWVTHIIDQGQASDMIRLVKTWQERTDKVLTTDYDDIGYPAGSEMAGQADGADPVSGATQDLDFGSDITDDAWNRFTLNETGAGWIEVATSTKFGIRNGYDVDDIAIAQGVLSYIKFRTYEYADVTYDPFLTIEYTEGGGEPAASQKGSMKLNTTIY